MKAPPVVSPRDAWPFARLLIGADLNGELAELPDALRPAAAHLARLAPEDRPAAMQAIVAALGPMGDALILAASAFGRADPRPEAEPSGTKPARRPATIADLRVMMSDSQWLWEGWAPAGRVCGMAGSEGTGKTRLALDLARRMYHGLDWPDGQGATVPAGTRTLWLCSDGQQDEIAETAAAFGLPDDGLAFCTLPEEPYGGVSVDDPETLELMGEFLGAERFGLVFIDSLTYATGRDLCVARDTKAVGTPLRDLAQKHGASICPLCHLAKDGGILGRRIRGLTRTLMQVDAPDPENQPGRLRLWVPKSYAPKPPALGVTMGAAGNTYDHKPPSAPPIPQLGRPPAARGKAIEFIVDELRKGDRAFPDLIGQWMSRGHGKSAIFDAKSALESEGRITVDASRKPQVLHLNPTP